MGDNLSTFYCVISHERDVQLQEAISMAEGRAAHSDNIIRQLQAQIANSDYFILNPDKPDGEYLKIYLLVCVYWFYSLHTLVITLSYLYFFYN